MALQSTTALATITLQSATPSITFSGIPNTYRDLILVGDYTGSSAASLVLMSLNGVTTNQTRVNMFGGAPSAVGSSTGTNIPFNAVYGSNRSISTAQFLDYARTDKHKTILIRSDNGGNSETSAVAARWASLDAINSIGLTVGEGTIAAGSTFSLYGRIA